VELDRIDEALIEYEKAADYYPENPELPYWTAVSLADVGRLDEALPIFKDVFERFPDLRILTPRLVGSGLLPDDPELINTIISQ
jgi:tetratricopeptide (TPR) repeat protein